MEFLTASPPPRMLPNARFTELLTDIEPSPTTKSNASSAHTGVRDHLWAHKSFRKRMESDFLAGSYARDTAIRPRKAEDEVSRPDIDIILVTSFSTDDSPDDVLEELADALEPDYKVERINKRSVRVGTRNAEMDLVPVTKDGESYQLPDRDLGYWKRTDPPRHIEWSREQNEAFEGRFKPLVKLFKWWRRENPTGKRPKGFVLEVLAAKHAPRHETHYGEAFTQMLESIHGAYAGVTNLGIKPTIEDPAVPGSDIMSKVSMTDWKNFMERIRVHAAYARRAQEEEDAEKATELWQRLFGPRFKGAPKAVKAAALNTVATVSASSATAYTFPNANAAPKSPRGFA